MVSEFNQIRILLEEIDSSLQEKAHFYVIGGAMLLYHNLKSGTKDVDIIVESKKEFTAAEQILKKLRFVPRIPTFEYKNVELSQIFIRGDFRIYLFHKTVCKGFSLSKGMIKRSKKALQLKNLAVSLCSKEDVFLFKTFTEREGDIKDCLILAQAGMDWNVILEELKNQIKESGNNVWVTMVGERLQVLEERGLPIPIMPQIMKLVEKYFEDYEKRIAKK